ncbi:MAG: V4R domain-containing protein [Candidatus Odinarchaeota archaeon]
MPFQPIRLKFFTSKHCKWCPQVDNVVRRVVGAAFGKSVFVNTVDVDYYPEIASRYGISILPSVMIENELVLSGGMSEDMVKDKLMQSLFGTILNRREQRSGYQAETMENLLGITRHVIDAFTKRMYIRETVGDYVHLSAIQMINISILSLDRLSRILLYEAGKNVGKYGPGQLFLYNLNPKIMKYYTVGEKFGQMLQALEKYYSNPKEIPILVADRAMITNIKNNVATLRLYGSALAEGVPELGEALCSYISGEIAGLIEGILGMYADVEEIKCHGLGDPYCEFEIKLLSNEKAKTLPVEKDKSEVAIRRRRFFDTLSQLMTTHNDSLFMRTILRQRGDFVHISLLQQIISALKETDEYTAMLLYSAGFEFGRMSPKEALSREIWKNKFSLPLSFKDAVTTVAKAFEYPTEILRRIGSFTDCKIIDDETAEITIYECCYSSGFDNRGKTYCDFSAGFIAGRLSLIYNEEAIVEETRCHGNGHTYCTFRITIE